MNNQAEITITPVIGDSWKHKLAKEFAAPYFAALKQFLLVEKRVGCEIYPPGPLIFNAFNSTEFENVKVVIIGQDPYHGRGQANGLCFSVADGVPMPPSLKNIFKEVHDDLGISLPASGNLENWAKQGVLLLNATLTVRAGEPGSHQNKGWEQFTDAVIRLLSDEGEHLVFLLWGRFAQAKSALIDSRKHYVLKAAHPSPFSAYNGFLGCRHFSKTNDLLVSAGKDPINWHL